MLDVFTRRLVVGLPTPVSYSDRGWGGLEAESPMSHRRDGRCNQRRRLSAVGRREGRRSIVRHRTNVRRWRTWLRTEENGGWDLCHFAV